MLSKEIPQGREVCIVNYHTGIRKHRSLTDWWHSFITPLWRKLYSASSWHAYSTGPYLECEYSGCDLGLYSTDCDTVRLGVHIQHSHHHFFFHLCSL